MVVNKGMRYGSSRISVDDRLLTSSSIHELSLSSNGEKESAKKCGEAPRDCQWKFSSAKAYQRQWRPIAIFLTSYQLTRTERRVGIVEPGLTARASLSGIERRVFAKNDQISFIS
jgi:hypothetical protein